LRSPPKSRAAAAFDPQLARQVQLTMAAGFDLAKPVAISHFVVEF
jgi:hypothetical protein